MREIAMLLAFLLGAALAWPLAAVIARRRTVSIARRTAEAEAAAKAYRAELERRNRQLLELRGAWIEAGLPVPTQITTDLIRIQALLQGRA